MKEIPFARPYFADEDVEEISRGIAGVLRSGWLTSGTNVKELEDRFAELTGTKYAIAVNSCTAALHAILMSLDIGVGDEVIVPANTFAATANVALYVGARPVFADCEKDTFNVSPKSIASKISEKTRAVIIVHLAGNPCDIDEIKGLLEKHSIHLIEDCAHAHGSKYHGANCGTFGVAGAFSFYPTKIITTAEGGIITTNQKRISDRVHVIRNVGRAGYGPQEITDLGYNFRMTDIHGVIGLNQIRHLEDFISERNNVAQSYSRGLSTLTGVRTQIVKDRNRSSYFAYLVALNSDASVDRDSVISKLKTLGVNTSVLYHPVHLQPLYRRLFGFTPGSLPVAEELGNRSLALPMFNGMTIEDAQYVVDSMKRVLG
jgi:perosamine synthetase